MWSITWWHFQWPWCTSNPVFKVTAFLKSNISKMVHFRDKFLKNTNRKPYTIYRMIPLSMTLSDLWSHFKVTTFSKFNIVNSARLQDKVTIAHWKLYLTYEIELCLVTLTRPRRVVQVCQHQLSFLLLQTSDCTFTSIYRHSCKIT